MEGNKELKPVRIIHVLGSVNLGGAESRVMELYRAMDRDKVQFDFLLHNNQQNDFSEEIRKLGGKIYHIPRFKVYNFFQYRKAIKDFFAEHNEFIAVHGHMTSTAAIYLPVAKRVYQKKNKGIMTIAHARSAGVDRGIKGQITKIIRRPVKKIAEHCFTCSYEAGLAVYGSEWISQKKVWTVPDAIDTTRFAFQKDVREAVRKELGIEDKFVIGHVGRMAFMKNHKYLVEVFAEVCKKEPNAVLVLVGQGEEKDAICEQIKQLHLEEKVYLLGNRMDVERYYQAFDYFVFPSMFEGLPGTVTEAQTAGLHCLISDRITKEVALTDLVSFRSIEEEPVLWANEIIRNKAAAMERKNVTQQMIDGGFDVKHQAVQMEAFYKTGMNPPGYLTRKE